MNTAIDWQSTLMAFLSITCAVLGWLARELWDAVKSLRLDLAALEVRVSRDYVSYDRLRDAIAPVMVALEDIKRVLHDKQDKP